MSTLPLFDRPEAQTRSDEPSGPRVLRVAQLNREVRSFLEDGWKSVWVQGELSDVTRAASGHVYFTLNDEQEPAQLRAVMFRGDARRARAPLKEGARVKLRGNLSLYEPRGAFQLIAKVALPAGDGELAAMFQQLCRKLQAEGLFDPGRKRALPMLPRAVGVVTSCSGAALHDIVRVAARRCPVRFVVADCRVQGKDGPSSIAEALQLVQRFEPVEVVIVARGGGAAEDLWAFNDEQVARAIAACRIPVVSGVGHQSDVTIADLVADVRAATPSNAAEVVVPERSALRNEIETWSRRVERAMETQVGRARLRLERQQRLLNDPRHRASGVRRTLEELTSRMGRTMYRDIQQRHQRHRQAAQSLWRCDPRTIWGQRHQRLLSLEARLRATCGPQFDSRRADLTQTSAALRKAVTEQLRSCRMQVGTLAARMDAMSPVKVLGRGYAIVLHEATGRAVREPSEVQPGDRLDIRVAKGQLKATAEQPQ